MPTGCSSRSRLSLSVGTPRCVFVASLITACNHSLSEFPTYLLNEITQVGGEGGDGAHVQFSVLGTAIGNRQLTASGRSRALLWMLLASGCPGLAGQAVGKK